MPSPKTLITEITTGLGMLGEDNLNEVLQENIPEIMLNVTASDWRELCKYYQNSEYTEDFSLAWEAGKSFFEAVEGLRNQPPFRIEWKGSHVPPAFWEKIPADLRVNHVYLVSCKFGSKILQNTSPANLFLHLLEPLVKSKNTNWYDYVAKNEHQMFYESCLELISNSNFPKSVNELNSEQKKILKSELKGYRRLPEEQNEAYKALSEAVSTQPVQQIYDNLNNNPASLLRKKEQLYWRLIRLESAPYFGLGFSPRNDKMFFRVATPWDFRQLFEFIDLKFWNQSAGQPAVNWQAKIHEKKTCIDILVDGHVEIRWSHGRFCGPPEAKIYLDTPHHHVPGYFVLS